MTFTSKSKYNFDEPEEKFVLPKVLKEISGLTDYDKNTIACIQDEKGKIFIYDLIKKEITKEIKFDKDKDYEGIARVGSTFYVLESDGDLYRVKLKDLDDPKVKRYETEISAKDNEALCYDMKNNRLLLGSKVKNGKKSDKNLRYIFAFDLDKNELSKKPAFELDKKEVEDFAEKNDIHYPTKKKKKSDFKFSFGISGISIDPKTQDLYVLCARDHLILIYNKNGKLKDMTILDEKKYPQAEGITFFENGDLFISNEAHGDEPTLLRFIKAD